MFMRKFEFFALGSDCALQLFAEEEGQAQEAATASIREIARIETRYSRYLEYSELSRINATAKSGGTIEVDAETGGLIDYAFACYRKSNGLFDISSGLLRKAWSFSSDCLPSDQASRLCYRELGSIKSSGILPA